MSELMNYILISIFLSFPEIILMLILGLRLCNIKLNMKQILLVAMVQSIVAFILRYYKIGIPFHTIVLIGTMWILVVFFMNIKLYKAIVPVFLGILIDVFLCFIIFSGINIFYEINYSLLNVMFVPTLIFAIPVKIMDIILIFLIRKTNFTLCNLGEEVEILG